MRSHRSARIALLATTVGLLGITSAVGAYATPSWPSGDDSFTVSVPEKSDQPVKISAENLNIDVDLPEELGSTPRLPESPEVNSFTSGAGDAVIVNTMEDSSVQFLIKIEDENSPQSFDFSISSSDYDELVINERYS